MYSCRKVLHGKGDVKRTPGTLSWTCRCHNNSVFECALRLRHVLDTRASSRGPRKASIYVMSSDGSSWRKYCFGDIEILLGEAGVTIMSANDYAKIYVQR